MRAAFYLASSAAAASTGAMLASHLAQFLSMNFVMYSGFSSGFCKKIYVGSYVP